MRRIWEKLQRDWRVRTTLPIVAIHVVAFSAVYAFTFYFSLNEVKRSFRMGAAYVLEESVNLFMDSKSGHPATSLQEGLSTVAKAHQSTSIAVFSPAGELSAGVPREFPFKTAGVRDAISGPNPESIWIRRDGEQIVLTGIQVLRNDAACQRCHSGGGRVLGAIGVQRDIGDRVRGTSARLRTALAYVSIGWAVLLGVSLVLRERVIGRPIARIEKSILGTSCDGNRAAGSHDLEALAGRVQSAVWTLLERQQARSHELEKGMERAAQLAALGDVAAGLSHEIKNPLAGLRAALGALKRVGDLRPEERTEIVEDMICEVDRVTRTVDSLLSLARPRSLVKTRTDLGRLARRATALFEARAREGGIALDVVVAPDVPSVHLDSDLIIQVVVNLVTNALDAVREGGSVRISVGPFPGRDGAMIAVADDGEGIPESKKARLFEPFFTTKHGGTGLGLPLCLRIVQQHGGTITVESEPGKGTTFVVLLPRGADDGTRKGEGSGVHPAR
ncbi:MAG: two-component system sensor histidine kinase NtrB [Thermoanaerobaculia bacterium]